MNVGLKQEQESKNSPCKSFDYNDPGILYLNTVSLLGETFFKKILISKSCTCI